MAYVNANDCFNWDSSGKAVFDGYDVSELARSYPTPFYLLSQKQIRSNFQQFQQAFSGADGGISIYYSVKSNFESIVLQHARRGWAAAPRSRVPSTWSSPSARGMKPEQGRL